MLKIIKCDSELIEEELHAAKHYIEKAMKYKDKDKITADLWYNLSLAEMNHVDMLHDDVVRLINSYRAENGEPPETMMFLYEYLHEKHIECAKEIKVL